MDEIRPLPAPIREPPEDLMEDEERDMKLVEVMLDGVFLLLREESEDLQETPPIYGPCSQRAVTAWQHLKSQVCRSGLGEAQGEEQPTNGTFKSEGFTREISGKFPGASGPRRPLETPVKTRSNVRIKAD